jgi:hypothetical protein
VLRRARGPPRVGRVPSNNRPHRATEERRLAIIRVQRLDHGPDLVIEDAQRLAYDFFTKDASSVGPKAYDAQVGKSDPHRITTADVVAINTTMRARSPHSAWVLLTDAIEAQPWLAILPEDLDLFRMTDDEWRSASSALEAALAATIGPYRNLSVATKVLHLKRPRLFPVLDSLVIQQLGGLGREHIELLGHVRSVGRANGESLASIEASLRASDIRRTKVRILDAMLWSSHPSAGLAGELGEWEHAFRPAVQ